MMLKERGGVVQEQVAALSPLGSPSLQTRPLLDFSLSLINRTGAYQIGKDLVDALGSAFLDVRYWRMIGHPPANDTARKVCGKLMLAEMRWLGDSPRLPWPKGRGRTAPTLFLDPLFTLRAPLTSSDVVLCHDVGPISHPHLFDAGTVQLYAQAYAKIARTRPGLVFVSETSQREFIRLFGDQYRSLHVIPLYVRPLAAASHTPDGRPEWPRSFILTVGALEKRKNYVRTLEAYRASGLHERGVDYIFVGPRGFGAEDILRAAQDAPGVTYAGYVTEGELRWLYANAQGFVLPSALEGFGMPALEAASFGLASVLSADSALEEAVDGAAVLVDPNSTASITAGMQELMSLSDEVKAALVRRGRDRAASLNHDRFIQAWRELIEAEFTESAKGAPEIT